MISFDLAIIASLLISLTLHQCPPGGVDFSNNFILGGDFSSPVIGVGNPPQQYPGGVGAWTCTIAEIGNGVSYNSNWGTKQVAALDTGFNQQYTQSFTAATVSHLFFSISFAKRQGLSPSTSGLRIYWNGRNVAQQPTSSDDLIHSITLNLTSIVGTNILIIEGMGHDDHEGTTISDVGIYPFKDFHRVVINGVCSCAPGYYDNGYNFACVACGDYMANCISCGVVPNITTLSASCLANTTQGVNCTTGTFTCTQCAYGYYLDFLGICQLIQIIPNLNPSHWKLEYVVCNKFKGQIQIDLLQYFSLTTVLTNSSSINITSTSISLVSLPSTYMIVLQADYTADISSDIVAFQVHYQFLNGTTNSQSTTMDMSSSNSVLVFYSQSQCSHTDNIQGFTTSIVVISYVVLAISLVSCKIVGLQLFGVLQLAFFVLADHETVGMFLKPLLQWRYVNGFNLNIGVQSKTVSAPFNLMGYKDNFLYNINIMFGLILLTPTISLPLYLISKSKPQQPQQPPCPLKKISLYILKLGLTTIFLFNSLNISFSIGTHLKYANSLTTPDYGLGTAGVIIGFVLYGFIVLYLQLTDDIGFGEFKDKFKRDCVNRFYVPLTILYRFVLGFYIAYFNQWYLSTLIILSVSISFIMFNLINLPFRNAYQNYRANTIHISQLIILFVSNYYRSMKYNISNNQKGKIHWPAILELIAICISILVSILCLGVEIWKSVKMCRERRKAEAATESGNQGEGEGQIGNVSGHEENKTEEEIQIDN